MKKTLTLTLFTLTILASYGQVKKVLFLGNSYTYGIDLPSMLKDIALSFGDTIYKDQNTPGGYTFQGHSTNTTTLNKIASDDWDFVILQEQSQRPSFPPTQVQNDTYPYATILNDSIKSNNQCTETVFFMTWGRENGDANNCPFYPVICTYQGMQMRLRQSYMEMGVNENATVAPVGAAWKHVRDSFPTIQLYQPDESHPSIYGTYLAACVFYATLYQKSPMGSSYISTLSANDAAILQNVAHQTVIDSLPIWRIGANLPVASFSASGGPNVTFTNNSTNGVSYDWDFGDGNTSTLQSPTHLYGGPGNYTVQLITHSNCTSDTSTQVINVTTTGIVSDKITSEFSLYPNPVKDKLFINSSEKISHINIFNLTGQKVKETKLVNGYVDMSDLNAGMYCIQLNNKETMIGLEIIIKD